MKKLMFALFSVFMFSGCMNSAMMPIQHIKQIGQDKAMITFIKPRAPGGSFMLFDIWDGERFIGSISNRTYIQYLTNPGEHLFLSCNSGNIPKYASEQFSYMKATLDAGKRYYVIIRPPTRLITGKVWLEPVKPDKIRTRKGMRGWFYHSRSIVLKDIDHSKHSLQKIDCVRNAIVDFEGGKVTFEVLKAEDCIYPFIEPITPRPNYPARSEKHRTYYCFDENYIETYYKKKQKKMENNR